MKNSAFARYSFTLLIFVSLLSPVLVLAEDGKKHFKQGLKHEYAEEWEQAVEEFSLAVVDSPQSPEYRLHLRRALFQASQLSMSKGRVAAEQKDYQAAYVAFRKAYAYDPVNELAKNEMARMVRLQEELRKTDKTDKNTSGVKMVQTSFPGGGTPQLPQKLEKLRNVLWPSGTDMQNLIKELASDLDLNVLFDSESFRTPRQMKIELRNVTAARALDYIFLQENLFFQKVGPRTILVANTSQRPKFQQLVLRTFYLANASPKDVKAIVQAAIPAQPGRQPTIVLEDAATNSITVRDTAENIRLIGRLISSLDKDRAEVVMDVAFYEVNKNDLLKIGNQVGTTGQLNNLGGSDPAAIPINGDWALDIARSVAMGFLIPSMQISAFQSKGDVKLLASTQIHAFNNEDSSARIGQRVPVRTATFTPVNSNPGNNNNNFYGDVINYEQIGLTLKFKPIVFPNQDVQVAMEIEFKDRGAPVEGDSLTPIFTERTIKGTARIQNSKTLLLASVAQDTNINARSGLPVLGWLPIIGRLFTAPSRNNNKVDIVIAVTPRVLRAPSILPDDEAEKDTGSVGQPTNSSLEAMIIQEERDELLASARKLPTDSLVQLPDRPADVPAYVRDDKAVSANTSAAPSGDANATVSSDPASVQSNGNASVVKPIDNSVKTLQITQTSDTTVANPPASTPVSDTSAISATVKFGDIPASLKAGDKIKIPVLVDASSIFRSALVGLKYDPLKFSVGDITLGDVFGAQSAGKTVLPFLNQNGKTYVTLAIPDGVSVTSKGIIAYLEVSALSDGPLQMEIDKDVLNFLTLDGKNFSVKVQ
ncbi:MAG: secretin N-terminal domain-containing protein [Pyrinomonadaceae bacterium]